MSNDDVMLTAAYCCQSDSIEPAEAARRHASDWFYCTEEICLIEVRPVQGKKNFFFRALRGALHDPRCRYFKEPNDDEAEGDPKPKPTPDPVPLIPTILGQRQRQKQFRKPTRDELLLLVKAASERPPAIYGTLEEVVCAWEKMSPQEKALAPLMVGGEQLTYREAFVFLAWIENFEALKWDSRIAYGLCEFQRGKVDGFFFLTSRKKFLHNGVKKPLHITIKPGEFPADLKLVPPDAVGTIFWHGPPPDTEHNQKLLKLHRIRDERYQGFVFRSHIYNG